MSRGHSTAFAFCETIAASLTHIRALGPKGRMPGGGADTKTLCDAKAEWDTLTVFSADAVARWDAWPYSLCSVCKAMFIASSNRPKEEPMTNITTPHNVDLVLGHGNCFDGFTAMWVVWLVRGDACEYKQVFYGDPPPDVTGKHVAILDFAYDRDVLEEMAAKAASILVLDHHATNERKLAGLPYAQFDMQRSGAMLAYNWCGGLIWESHGEDAQNEAYNLAMYMQDRDLWQWNLLGSREVSAALALSPFDFEAWTAFANRLYQDGVLVVGEGRALLAQQRRQVEYLADTAQLGILDDQLLWICNGPYWHTSNLGNLLSEREGPGVAAVWRYDQAKGRLAVSLRSSEASGVDVSRLAERYGGGGHKHAAGFEVDGWPPTLPFTLVSPEQIAAAERLANGES